MSDGVTSFLFQGATPVTQPTGSDSSTNFPLWLQQTAYNVNNAATNLAGQNYNPFPGPQVASPSPTTTQAWQTAVNNVGNYQPSLNQAGALTQTAGQGITGQDINQFLNPYTSDVTGALAQLAGQNLTNNLLPGVNDTFTGAGQFGSSGNAEFTNRAIRDTQQSLLNAQAGALQQGYQGALTAAQQQKAQQLAAGAQTGQLGALTQQLGSADYQNLLSAGNQQDTLAQANINAQMNNFQQQQQWPYQNLGFLSNIVHGLPVGSTTQTASATPASVVAPSAAASGLSTALGASALGFAKGGNVVELGALSRARATKRVPKSRGHKGGKLRRAA